MDAGRKRILLTGAAGYIGMRLAEAMAGCDWVENLVGVDVREPRRWPSDRQFIQRDIRLSLEDVIASRQVNTIVHLAFVVRPIHSWRQTEDINCRCTADLLEAAARCGVRHFLYTSSTTAYGFHPDNPIPLTEDSPLRGNNDFLYSRNKRQVEEMIRQYVVKHPAVAVTVLRPCFVVGPGASNPLTAHLRQHIVLLPRRTAPFQFVHVDDLIGVMTYFLRCGKPGTYNVAGEGTMTLEEAAALLGRKVVRLPWWLLYVLNAVAWRMRLSDLTQFPCAAMKMTIYPWIASAEKLMRETPCRLRYSSREAFKDFAQAARAGPRMLGGLLL